MGGLTDPCDVPFLVWRQVEALRGRLEALQGASNAALKDKASLTDQLAQAQQQLQARVKELAAAQQQIQQLKATAADAGKAASAAQQQAAAGAAAAAAKAGQQAAGLEQVAALQKQLKEKEAEVRRSTILCARVLMQQQAANVLQIQPQQHICSGKSRVCLLSEPPVHSPAARHTVLSSLLSTCC